MGRGNLLQEHHDVLEGEELGEGEGWVLLHELLDGLARRGLKELAACEVVGGIEELAEVHVAGLLRESFEARNGILTQEIEDDAVVDDILARHRLTSLFVVETQIGGIVLAEVFVERDANGLVVDNDTLVEAANLSVEGRNLKAWNLLHQFLERLADALVDIGHISKFRLCGIDDILERAVLIEVQESLVDIRIGNRAQLQQIFNQSARLSWIDGIHFLKGGKVASGEITTLHSIVALNLQAVDRVVGNQFRHGEIACYKNHHKNRI